MSLWPPTASSAAAAANPAPPALIRLAHFTSKVSAYLEHKLAADLSVKSWEYIVVGAGSAGSVVAGRLMILFSR